MPTAPQINCVEIARITDAVELAAQERHAGRRPDVTRVILVNPAPQTPGLVLHNRCGTVGRIGRYKVEPVNMSGPTRIPRTA